MENSQHIKSLNTTKGSKNRIRYASARQRAKRASADVYRSYKQQGHATTSAASREERVHHQFHRDESSSRRKRAKTTTLVGDSSRVAIVTTAPTLEADHVEGNETTVEEPSSFAEELDLAHDRNASELFGAFYREVWPLVRSLPEVLHHAPVIVELCMSYLLSPLSNKHEASPGPWVVAANEKDGIHKRQSKEGFVVNLATTDVLHLLSVLAKELRHEIHIFVHSLIVPRIVHDLLNPPLASDKQPIPLDVVIVEAAFRTLSYIFRYDTVLLEESLTTREEEEFCLEPMRQYYGATLGHKRDYIRRLAAETLSPLIRRLDHDSARKRHVKRVIRALAAAASQETSSTTNQRSLVDATDGVSLLLYYTARGVPGQLHSKGHFIIKCTLDCITTPTSSNHTNGNASHKLVYEIVKAFLEKLERHVSDMERVWKELLKATEGLLTKLEQQSSTTSNQETSTAQSFAFMLQLLEQSVSFRDGHFFQRNGNDQMMNRFLVLLERIFLSKTGNIYEMLSPDVQTTTWALLCSVWRALPVRNDHSVSVRLRRLLSAILSQDDTQQVQAAAQYVTQQLLPHLPREVAIKQVGTAVLAAAAQLQQEDNTCLVLIHSVATCRLARAQQDSADDDDDRIFFVENAIDCDLSPQQQATLLDVCLVDILSSKEKHGSQGRKDGLAKLGYTCRCIPLLALVGERTQQPNKEILKRLIKWFEATMQLLDEIYTSTLTANVQGGIAIMDVLVTKALVLESLATVSMEFSRRLEDASPLKSFLSRTRSSVVKLLLTHPSSIWSVKSVAAFVQALQDHELEFSDSPNEVIDILIPNLRHKSHVLRLHTLRILNSFPTKPFVTDYADLDLTDDLDEEPSAARNQSGQAWASSQSTSGPCDVLTTLLTLESSPVNLQNERHITSLITRVEVLGRTRKLPVSYAEAASNHMFGILHIKFSPMWPAAVRALVALASSQEECAWPPIEAMLKQVMLPSCDDLRDSNVVMEENVSSTGACLEHHRKCVAWDETNGNDSGLFAGQVKTAQTEGRVSRHQNTDSSTIFEQVWSVMEGIPHVTTKKSRVVVPIFLSFLHFQYYLFHQNDPDAREFRLEEHVQEAASWTFENLQRKGLQRKLSSFLKMFAAVNGPQQLYKHSFLLSIFLAFLSHQDAGIAQLALACVLKFKLPHVIPYADHLKRMLKKGELRETLVKFDVSRETGVVDVEHREKLIALLSRILFGRLSARASGGKSSKDSPSARRAAVLSFLSILGGGPDLNPFVYLMVRSFVPADTQINPMESHSDEDRNRLIVAMQALQAKDVRCLTRQRQEGFLNLLSDVIAQLGYGVKSYVSTFMSIVLALCEFAEVGQGEKNEGDYDEDGRGGSSADHAFSSLARIGVVRTLCFRRLEELVAQYTSTHDFTGYSPRLWGATASSIRMLPGTAVNADKPPALLLLLVTISSHRRLIPMLSECPAAVEAVIKCIETTSRPLVVDASLKFVDNLLRNGDAAEDSSEICYDSEGVELVRRHIPLLMQQFAHRLNLAERDSGGSALKRSSNNPATQTTWRELAILCRVSDLVVHEDAALSAKGENTGASSSVFANLCELLIPFLGHEQRASEDDLLNVIGILNSILPKVDVEIARSHLTALSRALGPHKSRRGITSLLVRQKIATIIETIANGDNSDENLKSVSIVLNQLSSTHDQRVDEVDYDKLIPALNMLGDVKGSSVNWLRLSGVRSVTNSPVDVGVLSLLIQTCFHFLFDDDGVVSRGAFKALKTLIATSSQQASIGADEDTTSGEGARKNQWVSLVEKSVVPYIRPGLNASSQQVRRFFILLLAEVSHLFERHTSPNLYGDLGVLVRTDDPDLDFFKNITHVQIHRRCRALQRLRKMLNADADEAGVSSFTMQSLANVLLPIAMHPVYECKSRTEETYALEAIATVGAIGSHLSWNKYNNTLWTALTQFPRHPDQERYVIGVICSLIDAFHYEVVESTEDNGNQGSIDVSTEQGSAVWRALEKRIIPKVEAYLIKEKVDRSGTKVKTVRSPVVLALLKLFRKFPTVFFEAKLPRLLAVMCDSLKSRDSDARDAARTTLAKMAVELDMKYLLDVIRELSVTLNEGYQLHVRSATIHSILLEVAESYTPPKDVSEETLPLPFDRCIPALVDLIQQDMFGEATERREAEGVQKRVVKEASGAKSIDSIEVICRLLLFRPSLANNDPSGNSNLSSVHVVVSPLLERLRGPDVNTTTVGKIRECLKRVVVGLSHNSCAEAEEILPFVYASIEPFVSEYRLVATRKGERSSEDLDSSDDETGEKPISISGAAGERAISLVRRPEGKEREKGATNAVVEWRPSTLNSAASGRDALGMKIKERKALGRVQDGATAPKLTGSSRYSWMAVSSSRGLNDRAGISAVVFGLSLLHSVLKRIKFNSQDSRMLSMMDGFVPILTTCVCVCRDNDVVLLSLKCLGSLLRFNLPSVPTCTETLGTKILDLLTSSGALSNLHHELTQGCFKALTLLIHMDKNLGHELPENRKGTIEDSANEGEQALSKSSKIPLDSDQMQVLVSLLQASVGETDHHNSTFSLIKAIASRRFASTEFYDLMETLLQLSVRSHKPTVRQQSSQIFLHYLVEYPMGRQRLEGHLKQMVLNIKYEYEDGRLCAIGLVTAVIDKLPLPLLEEQAQLFFLPLVLHLVNDESKECREAVAKCLSRLLSRVSMDVVQTLYDYTVKWSSQGTGPLQQTSLQLFGIFVDARLDFIKRGDVASELIDRTYKQVKSPRTEGLNDWKVPYFSLLCLEKLAVPFPALVAKHTDLWTVIVECLVNPHPWVKQIASRLLGDHLATMDPAAIANKNSESFLTQSGSLFDVAQNLCLQLNVPESEQNEELSATAIKSLTWVVQAMDKYPHLCFVEGNQHSEEGDLAKEEKNPVAWLMTRLSNVAKPKGEKRREAVFKCFAAFTTYGGSEVVSPYLELMIEPLHRCIVEVENVTEHASKFRKTQVHSEEGDLAKDVLQLLEEQCGSKGFLEAYAAVKIRAREKREQRKQKLATEAVQDPQAAAARKMRKHESERKRRKRKVEERRKQRGGTAKRRHIE